MNVLIITKSDDNQCVQYVTRAVEERGGSVFRLDTDRFPTELRLAVRYGPEGERLTLASRGDEVDLGKLAGIWHRRLDVAARIPDSMDEQLRSASVRESRRTLMGALASLRCFVMDPVPRLRHAGNKQLQLRVARDLGLETPRTLITNDPAAVRSFAAECTEGIITKMLASFAVIEEGQEQVVFTNPVSDADIEDLSGLDLCPMTFQEKVPKELELRVTVVGDRVFTASVDSQAMKRATIDWRREGQALADAWHRYDLPAEVERGLLALMDNFGLNYGAIDLIVTPDGRHVFLEVNPSGEFFWLEDSPGLPISDAIADVLMGRAFRRETPLLVEADR